MKLSHFIRVPFRHLRCHVGTYAQKELARSEQYVAVIRRLERGLGNKSDEKLKEFAKSLRKRSATEPLNTLLPEVFALVCEVAHRTIGLRPFDVQLIGGSAIHRGNIAEMKTGEGKTLVASLPGSLNALTGKGVHIVTVNDYLARRDAEWMGPIYEFLGLTVGVVTEDLDPDSESRKRKAAYACDITYVTNHELVFDYLRDHLALSSDETVGRALHFAVVDEVDFLLLDEARTPLIISGPAEGETNQVVSADSMVREFKEGTHYELEPKIKRAVFLDSGYLEIEKALSIKNLADPEHLNIRHALHNALLAHAVYQKDVDYVVKKNQIMIVDEFTGRLTPEKRYADGLHQALEAKERVRIQGEDMTLAKITYQNYFRLYPKLSGMTGTAYTEKEEFSELYNLGVVRIPTHRRSIRQDYDSLIFKTENEKFHAVIKQLQEDRARGRPVLVGSISIRDTEKLSKLLSEKGIPHEVLNAKNHAQEAAIIAQAGRSRAVSISTNMAGRGTDILLGGKRVVAAGGLSVLGTEWFDSSRIDDQLRGRAGRQGDPGSSRFFVSLDDAVYKKFGKLVLPDLKRLVGGHAKNEIITNRTIRKALNDLRAKVEIENRAIRREVFRYDLAIEEQRKHIYTWRMQLLEADEATMAELLKDSAQAAELEELVISGDARAFYQNASLVFVKTLDDLWTQHLNTLESIDEGIGLRGYAEKDPLVEFRKEAGALFLSLPTEIKRLALTRLMSLRASSKPQRPQRPTQAATRRKTRKQ